MILNNNIQLPKLFLERIKQYLSNDDYDKFILSLNQKEKKGFALNLNKLKNNKVLFDEIIDIIKPILIFNNDNYNYYTYDETNIKNCKSIGNLIYSHQGLYYVQEPSASLVIKNIKINENDKILDLCAAPGGKSIDCLFNLKNGFIVSNDINKKRAYIISNNIEKLGFDNAIITNNNPEYFELNFKNYFNKVIIDAPCSGEGMMRKNNVAINQWSINLINSMSKIQKKLVDIAYNCLKDDGIMIYSTCTFAKEENENIIDYLINKYANITILMQQKIYFHHNIGEGQFFAILKKEPTNDTNCYENKKNFTNKYNIINLKNTKDHVTKDLKILLNEIFNYDFFNDLNINIIQINNKIYIVNTNIPFDIIKMQNIIKIGIQLAEIKKDKISLSHDISHSKYYVYFKQKIDLTINEANKYLKGESFDINTKIQGICLVTYKNIPLGICKIINSTLKNYYPKGLRNFN